MQRIDTATAQKDKFGPGKNGFTDGNPQTGTPATDLDSEFFDSIQEEICGVIESTGVELDAAKRNQLLTAINSIISKSTSVSGALQKDQNLADVEDAAESRQNLKLGDSATKDVGTTPGTVAAGDDVRFKGTPAGTFAIGVPFYWSLSAMPNEVLDDWADMVFLKSNGAAFDGETYANLALMYPSLTLPDARGKFVRVFDDGAGIDAGRELLSIQGGAAPNITGSVPPGDYSVIPGGGNGAFASGVATTNGDFDQWNGTGLSGFNIDASRCSPIYNSNVTELRPDNVAFNFLVRAL